MTIANRTIGRARALAGRFGADSVLLSDLPRVLPAADIVITSTAADLPVLGKGMVETAIRQRKRRPMLLIDIAVPRDIEQQVGALDDIFLYTIDDLAEIVAENRRSRAEAAEKAELIIARGVSEWLRDIRSREAVATVKAYRSQAETISQQELERHLRRLRRGDDPEEVLARMAHSLTNKLIHTPSRELREAGAEGREEMLAHGRRLLGVDPTYHDE